MNMKLTIKIALTDGRPVEINGNEWPVIGSSIVESRFFGDRRDQGLIVRQRLLSLDNGGQCIVYGYNNANNKKRGMIVDNLDWVMEAIRKVAKDIDAEEETVIQCLQSLPAVKM